MAVMCRGKRFGNSGGISDVCNYSGKKIQDINHQFEKIIPTSCSDIIANKCKSSYFYFLQTFWDVFWLQ